MSANHLSPVPPPAWTWKIADDQHPDKFFPPQRPHYHHHQQLQQQQLLPEGNRERRELLFEKPLTPSDVGKLNRLVIPKQHAERHFPFYGDSSCGEKGLLLTFEDESGRAWQFRYSYWTSSQSYVLTKGWSRFVKDKKLDAGDVVLFERRRGDGSDHRLYIGCKRRGEHSRVQDVDGAAYTANINVATTTQWNPAYHNNYAPSPPGYSYTAAAARTGPLHDAGEQVGGPAARAGAGAGTSWRRLRLFGVNLDCGPEQEQPESRMPSSSSSGSNSNSNGGLCMDGYGRSHRLDPTRSRGYSSPQW